MGNKLLVRSYNVGCGDCIYVRIPDDNDGFHILIDCGSKESASTKVMRRAIKHLADHMLPDDNGKKRLDLIVVTHRHEDHIKGFNPTFFKKIAIRNIWITAAMDEAHTQANKARELHRIAGAEMRKLAKDRAGVSSELRELINLYGVNNDNATKALLQSLPAANGIQPKFVHATDTSDTLGLSIQDAKITVLAPEEDIDGYYLGEEADESLRGFDGGKALFNPLSGGQKASKVPANISQADFRMLQSRVLSNALAFAVDDSEIQNNVSTVILIEWKKRRLLFVGDAEWKSRYAEGKKNGSWNVMWKNHKSLLNKPLDFLKVGHHGSHNATPWIREESDDHEVNQILNAMLPIPPAGEEPTAQCIVSTKRKQYDTIPDSELLVELGKRVCNTKVYLDEFQKEDSTFDPEQGIYNYSVMKTYAQGPSPREVGDKGWLDEPQPWRTDMESEGKGKKEMIQAVEFVDVEIAPAH